MTFKEMQDAVYDELGVTNSDTFFTLVLIKRYINRAKRQVENSHNWPHLDCADTRSSEINQEYYNYPENWKPFSIDKLKYNSENYKKTDYKDYLAYQESGLDPNCKMFASYRNQFFISPIPVSVIEQGIEIWGQELSADMSEDDDVTPFTAEPEIEEIIVNLALAMCHKKARGSRYAVGQTLEQECLARLEVIYKKIRKRQSNYTNKNRQMFSRINLFPGTNSSAENFSINQ
ncbi:MAG: hypothetical protein PHQ46_10725 [Negativicutes bacterium]|nr:hypothetical protein [Negativicutes bacterium]